MFVGINCFLFPQPRQWIEAHKNSMHLATDVMLQFPFYGAIMGMMYVENGLGAYDKVEEDGSINDDYRIEYFKMHMSR